MMGTESRVDSEVSITAHETSPVQRITKHDVSFLISSSSPQRLEQILWCEQQKLHARQLSSQN